MHSQESPPYPIFLPSEAETSIGYLCLQANDNIVLLPSCVVQALPFRK